MERKHREACDACHNRKVRCASQGPGACSNCQSTGRVCVFSPSQEMGRPRKAGRRKDRSEVRASQRKTGALDLWEEPCDGAVIQPWMMQHQPRISNVDDMCQSTQVSISQSQSNLLAGQFESPIDIVLPSPAFTPRPSTDPQPNQETQRNTHHVFESILSEEPGEQQGMPDLEDTLSEFTSRPFSFQTPPNHSPVQLESSKPTTDSFTLDIYHHICRIIFDLRPESNMQSTSASSASLSVEEIFSSVTSLCDVLQSVLIRREGLNGNLYSPSEESSATFMLALTAISKVLDRYRSLSQVYSRSIKACREPMSLSHEWLGFDTSIGQASSALPSSHLSTCRHLNDLLRLTTMDFHLAQLQRIFRHLHPKDNSQYASVAEEGGGNIQELRASLQGSMETLREGG